MKSTGTWISNTGATNESGFAGLPGGYRDVNGSVNYLGFYGYWWTQDDFNKPYVRYLSNTDGSLTKYAFDKKLGFSVRCLRD